MRNVNILKMDNHIRMSPEDFQSILTYMERTAKESENERDKVEVAELLLKMVGTGAFNPERFNELYNQKDKKYISSAIRLLKSVND